jgi:hypothetical protein
MIPLVSIFRTTLLDLSEKKIDPCESTKIPIGPFKVASLAGLPSPLYWLSPSAGALPAIVSIKKVGLAVGLVAGSAVGLAVGSAVGLVVGSAVGLAVGLANPNGEGREDGCIEGWEDGCIDGWPVGNDGLLVGWEDGCIDGWEDGWIEGSDDGWDEGCDEGWATGWDAVWDNINAIIKKYNNILRAIISLKVQSVKEWFQNCFWKFLSSNTFHKLHAGFRYEYKDVFSF